MYFIHGCRMVSGGGSPPTDRISQPYTHMDLGYPDYQETLLSGLERPLRFEDDVKHEWCVLYCAEESFSTLSRLYHRPRHRIEHRSHYHLHKQLHTFRLTNVITVLSHL